MLDPLTPLEKRVVDAARNGEVAQPAAILMAADLAVTDDPELRIRADLLRELLRGLHGDLDPRGIQVVGVRVVGLLDLDHVAAATGLDLFQCALPDGITCRSAHLRDLYLNYCLLTHLHADGLHTDSDLFARDATITSNHQDGAIRLLDAHIGSHLILDHTTITNTIGPALYADRIRTDSNLFARDARITCTGDGAIRLLGAEIGGQLDLDRTTIANTLGPALDADGAHTGGNLFVREAKFTGAGEYGAIRLRGAHIGGQADLRVAELRNSSGPLLVLQEAHITDALFPPSVVCPAGRTEVNRRGCPDSDRTITAHGLTYPILRDTPWRQWLHLLVHHTPNYWPQPFQQLATVERTAGHDNNARQILITQQDDLRRRTPEALGNHLGRWRHALWGRLGRYGYRANRLVVALVVVLALAAGLGYIAGQITTRPGHHAAERVLAPGTPCSTVELIGLGIDRGLPLGATGLRARCDLDTGTGWGQTITVALWLLQALLWGLATLAIASYTGLVRKPA